MNFFIAQVHLLYSCVSVLQLRCGLGDEAKESLEAFQSEEHQPVRENLPESTEWADGRWLAQTGEQPGGQRSLDSPKKSN